MKGWIGILLIVIVLTLAMMPRGLPRAEAVLDRPLGTTCRVPVYCQIVSRAEQLAWEIESLDLGP